MCGICGAITQPNPNIIKSLMIANERRGDKSTGIAYRVKGETTVFKDTVASSLFVNRIRDEKINESNLVICHTRMPSVGLAVSKKNAHPFRYNNVVGVHNGTVNNHADIKHSGEVDSQAIFHLLSLKKNKYEEVFPELNGSMAVAWVVDGDPNLYLVRHISPLCIAKVGRTLYFNSEALVLQSSLAAAGVEADIEEVEENKVYTITPSLEITKTPVTFKPYYAAPKYNHEATIIYPQNKPAWGLAPDYSLPASVTPAPWELDPNVDTRSETKKQYDAMFNRKGTRAQLSFNNIDPKGFWSMKQIVERYPLFKSDGSINKKSMLHRAKKPLESLLGVEGYNLIKESKDYREFSKIMMESFGCSICHIVSHQGFWFVKKNGFCYCNICATNNNWIKQAGEFIKIV